MRHSPEPYIIMKNTTQPTNEMTEDERREAIDEYHREEFLAGIL